MCPFLGAAIPAEVGNCPLILGKGYPGCPFCPVEELSVGSSEVLSQLLGFLRKSEGQGDPRAQPMRARTESSSGASAGEGWVLISAMNN